jgi:hypothetical protein
MVFVGCDRNLSGFTKEFFVGYKLCPDGQVSRPLLAKISVPKKGADAADAR